MHTHFRKFQLVGLIGFFLWVVLVSGTSAYEGLGKGSGFVVDPRGYILTNAHVVKRTSLERLEVWFESGEKLSAEVLKTDPNNDLALLKINKDNLPFLKLGLGKGVRRMEAVWAFGYPADSRALTVTNGYINSIKPFPNYQGLKIERLLETDAKVRPGSSGGPLVNERGEVVGIITGGLSLEFAEKVGYAIPLDLALPLLNEIPDFDPSTMGRQNKKLSGPEIDGRVAPAVVLVHQIAKGREETIGLMKKSQEQELENLSKNGFPIPKGMVLIPQGEFTMGGIHYVYKGKSENTWKQSISLNSFWIDRYEVTNDQFKNCVSNGTCKPPEKTEEFLNNDFAKHPVVYVNWHQAQEFCMWAGKRLPTAAEWEKGARGEDLRNYPWGNAWDRSKANFRGMEDGYEGSAPVGSFESGKSPYGVYDLSGNVWEWVADWEHDWAYLKTRPTKNPKGPSTGKVKGIRGGSFGSWANKLRFAYGSTFNPNWSDSGIGFRCAMDAKSE